MSTIDGTPCTLRLAAQGRVELCPHDRCAFWEPGGAALAGRCLVDRLGIDLRQTDLAGYLLETRERIEAARDLAEAEQTHRELSRRIGLEL
jgi:hypothetical protein